MVAPHLSYFNSSSREVIFVVLSAFYTLQVRSRCKLWTIVLNIVLTKRVCGRCLVE